MTFAQAQLAETLTAMMAAISAEASITVPVTSNRLDEAGIVVDAERTTLLKDSLAALASNDKELQARKHFVTAPCTTEQNNQNNLPSHMMHLNTITKNPVI